MKTPQRQEHRDLEKLGFLCRWALLALTMLVILTAAWAGLVGTADLSSDSPPPMLLSDAVWRQGKAHHRTLRGYSDGPAPKSAAPRFVYRDHLGDMRLPWFDRNRKELILLVPTPPAGTHRITIRGLPYGSMAFKQYQATLRIVPEPMTVYLLDARFLADVERDDKRAAIRIVKEFSRLGQPVLVFPGNRKLLKDLRGGLDQYSDIPHVFSFRKGRDDLPGIIERISQNLRRTAKDAQDTDRKPYVITADVEVAIATAGENHYTHLVGAEKAPANLPELIRLHATPEKLAEHLANERPAHLPIP